MSDEVIGQLAKPSGRRGRPVLSALALLTVGGALLGMALLYGAAQLWMLNDDAVLEIDLAEERPVSTKTANLLWPGIDHVFHTCCAESSVLVDDIGGRPARSFTIRPNDPLIKGSHRAEIRLRPNALGQEVWYRGEVYVPADWQPSDVRVTAMQWHGTRDVFLLEPGRTPPLQLEIIDQRWEVVKSWDQRLRTPDGESGISPSVQGRRSIAEVPLVKGQWADWTFFVRWATDDSGLIRVWRDGELVVEDNGPNAHWDLIGPYMKAGVYVPDWTLIGPEPSIAQRELYFSDLTLSGANNPFGLR